MEEETPDIDFKLRIREKAMANVVKADMVGDGKMIVLFSSDFVRRIGFGILRRDETVLTSNSYRSLAAAVLGVSEVAAGGSGRPGKQFGQQPGQQALEASLQWKLPLAFSKKAYSIHVLH
ncbi:hypothetical protein V6N11_071051 [Hibiscus sabdariffa]|uniref:Uncharacterized protein n=1 Tax=Hibiscus sabdariffa TaxID=183260 RepID=A0ABR1ZN19_9ROSI